MSATVLKIDALLSAIACKIELDLAANVLEVSDAELIVDALFDDILSNSDELLSDTALKIAELLSAITLKSVLELTSDLVLDVVEPVLLVSLLVATRVLSIGLSVLPPTNELTVEAKSLTKSVKENFSVSLLSIALTELVTLLVLTVLSVVLSVSLLPL